MADGMMVPDDQGYSTPRPDPTLLTTEQLMREIGALRAIIDLKIDASNERLIAEINLTNARFKAADQERHTIKTMVDERSAATAELLKEKFEGRDKALVAAMNAAKEAVEKANTATEKRFDTVNELLAAQTSAISELLPRNEADARINAIDARVADIKTIIDKGFTSVDVRHSGFAEQRDIRADSRANIAIAISVGIALLMVISMVLQNTAHITGQ